MESIVTITRHIWSRRNNFIFNNKFLGPQQLIQEAKQQLKSFWQAQSSEETCSPSQLNTMSPTPKRWQKPKDEFLEVNWDATVDKRMNLTGLGGIARDSKGQIHFYDSCKVQQAMQPVVAEAMALRQLMLRCVDLDLQQIIYEGDCDLGCELNGRQSHSDNTNDP